MHRLRNVVAAAAVAALVVLAVVNVVAPPGPVEDLPDHARAWDPQASDDLLWLSIHHGNAKARHYYGSYLAIGRITGGGILTASPDLFGQDHAFLAFSGLRVAYDDGGPDVDVAHLEALLAFPHTRGVYAEERLEQDPPTAAEWVVVHPQDAADRGGLWRAVKADGVTVIASDRLLESQGLAWE